MFGKVGRTGTEGPHMQLLSIFRNWFTLEYFRISGTTRKQAMSIKVKGSNWYEQNKRASFIYAIYLQNV